MKFNPYDIEPKLLVSDSIKDEISEEHLQQAVEMFISVGLVIEPKENSLTGNLVGIEFSEPMKLDMKVSLKDAFSFISKVVSNNKHTKKVHALLMLLGEESTSIPGPFKITSVKILEIESASKLCILAIDLTKDTQ